MQNSELRAEVLVAGYSYHTKPIHMQNHAGLDNYLIRLQVEGYAFAWVGKGLELITPGDLLIYKPGDPYELLIQEASPNKEVAQSGSGDYFIFCRGDWLDNWWQLKPKPQLINISLDETILALWQRVVAEKRRVWDELSEISDYLLRSLCLALDRAIAVQSENPKGSTGLAYRIKYFVEQNATTQFSLNDVAEYMDLSVSRIVHLFKATFGQSIIDYAIHVRLNIACERIQFTRMSLEQIAEASGFHNYSYFSRLFRARYNLSPSEYKLKYQK